MADSTYWRGRASSALYASNGALFTLARRHAGSARTLLDVGSYIPDIVKQYSWVPQKTATDTQSTANASAWAAVGIPFVRADFLRRTFPPHDLVTCTQVLEHLDDAVARRFVARLQQATAVDGVLVVSVPLEMPRGWVKGHTQDPLSRAEFASWFAGGGGAVVAHVDVVQHGQSAPLAVPQLGPCASSGRARRLWAARSSQEEAGSLGTQPLPRVLELAASKVADFTAFGHAGGGQASAMVSPWPAGAGAVSGPCLAARGQLARASARPARAVAWDGRAVGTTLWVGLGRKHSHAVAWLAPGKLACGAQRPSQDAAAARGLEKTHTRD